MGYTVGGRDSVGYYWGTGKTEIRLETRVDIISDTQVRVHTWASTRSIPPYNMSQYGVKYWCGLGDWEDTERYSVYNYGNWLPDVHDSVLVTRGYTTKTYRAYAGYTGATVQGYGAARNSGRVYLDVEIPARPERIPDNPTITLPSKKFKPDQNLEMTLKLNRADYEGTGTFENFIINVNGREWTTPYSTWDFHPRQHGEHLTIYCTAVYDMGARTIRLKSPTYYMDVLEYDPAETAKIKVSETVVTPGNQIDVECITSYAQGNAKFIRYELYADNRRVFYSDTENKTRLKPSDFISPTGGYLDFHWECVYDFYGKEKRVKSNTITVEVIGGCVTVYDEGGQARVGLVTVYDEKGRPKNVVISGYASNRQVSKTLVK